MPTTELRDSITRTLELLVNHADELRDLDSALGDGDLGITVSLGSKAVVAALAELPADAAPTEVARTCAKAFANANPSTMAALVAGALLAGSKTWTEVEVVDREATVTFGQAAAASIGKRGKSEVGDKTILDSLVPAIEALAAADAAASDAEALDAAIVAAEAGVVGTRDMQSKRGRASWLQERSIGLQDPGATAFLRFLESWRDGAVAR